MKKKQAPRSFFSPCGGLLKENFYLTLFTFTEAGGTKSLKKKKT